MILAASLLCAAPARAEVSESLRDYHRGQLEKALAQWQGSAGDGEPAAQSVLAAHYLFGLGVPQDEAKAAALFGQAADEGYTIAQVNLAELYRRGVGVERNPVQAFAWFGIAARNGHAGAAEQQEALAAVMDEIDVIEGERAILRWLDRWFPTELVGPANVVDGNRIEVEGHLLRLVGIEAPHIGRKCQIAGRAADCGVIARAQLKDLTEGARLRCIVLAQRIGEARAARCFAGGYDLSEGMVYTGWAYARGEHAERYAATEMDSRRSANGLWRIDLTMED
jgi:TPR repeat protein